MVSFRRCTLFQAHIRPTPGTMPGAPRAWCGLMVERPEVIWLDLDWVELNLIHGLDLTQSIAHARVCSSDYASGGLMRCDAEVGRPGHWTSCKRRDVTVEIVTVLGTVLHYCEQHEARVDDSHRRFHGPVAHINRFGVK
jgi:hypothetical protein